MSDPLLAPGLTASLAGNAPKLAPLEQRTRSTARDFEALFLNAMLQPMFQNVGSGPFGGGYAAGVWRSFLTDEYAKSVAKNGGVGIADQVYKSLMALQDVKSKAATSTAP